MSDNNHYRIPWEPHFDKELTALRSWLQEYASDYPVAAENLDLDKGKSNDPQIELLLQSFAYLTGRIQYNLELEKRRIPEIMLEFLYPHLSAPIPSMTVLEMDVDPNGANFAKGYTLEKGRLLSTQAISVHNHREPIPVNFTTSYSTELWPLEVSKVSYTPINSHLVLANEQHTRCALKLDIKAIGNGNIREWPINRLRLFIHGNAKFSYALYQALRLNCRGVLVEYENESGHQHCRLDTQHIEFQGFSEQQAVLPYKKSSHPAYRYLQEYFLFPDKFLFFDLLLDKPLDALQQVNVYLLFDKDLSQVLARLNKNCLKLNCVPAINLFTKTTLPFRLNHQQYDYKLVPDDRYYRGMEVHTVETVFSLNQGHTEAINSFLDSSTNSSSQSRYWQPYRRISDKRQLPGSEMYLSFHDPKFDPNLPSAERIYAKTLCTNRDLAEQLPVSSSLQLQGSGPVAAGKILLRPTHRLAPAQNPGSIWRLVSHLNLNHLSLTEGDSSLQAFKALLKLYSDSSLPSHQYEIDSLVGLQVKPITQRLGRDVWRGIGHGLAVTFTVDEVLYRNSDHGNIILLGEILAHFITLYEDINGFCQLIIKSQQTNRVIKQWKPLTGSQQHL